MAGALCATLGVTLPSFVIIYLISLFFDRFLEITIVANAFRGIKIAVGILIVRAAMNLWRKVKKDVQTYVIFLLSFGIMALADVLSLNISTIVLILAAGIIGMLLYKIRTLRRNGGTTE